MKMNIPNTLSILRILLIPVYAYVYLTAPDTISASDPSTYTPYLWAGAILIFSGLTDMLDGFIARKFNQITKLGRILDPFADKLTQATVTVTLAIRNPVWIFLPIAYILKELLMLIGGVLLLRKFHDLAPSKWFGKLATGVFYCATILLVSVPGMPQWCKTVLLCAVVITLVFAFIMYFPLFFRYFRKEQPMITPDQTAHAAK